MRVAALALALVLLVVETSAIRVFDQKHQHPHLKREIGRPQRGPDGKLHRKKVDADSLGRASFDPNHASEEDLSAEDLGVSLHDLHPPVDSDLHQRLREVFPALDADGDGAVSLAELQRHLLANGLAMARRRADREFADYDGDKDGRLTVAEYLANLLADGGPEAAAEKEKVERGGFPDPLDYTSNVDLAMAAFVYADEDHDGALSAAEFFHFSNPEDSGNQQLRLHRLRQDVFEHLTDHDDHHNTNPHLVLDFEQFFHAFWSQFTAWDGDDPEMHGEWNETSERRQAERKFVLLDQDADGRLTPEELLPVYGNLHPAESRYARMQAEHMMDMAEAVDDKMTLEEMLRVPHAFYGAVHDHEEHSEL